MCTSVYLGGLGRFWTVLESLLIVGLGLESLGVIGTSFLYSFSRQLELLGGRCLSSVLEASNLDSKPVSGHL